jgi:NADPH:quinone reductase-like Zn-dependent oxidoreductase
VKAVRIHEPVGVDGLVYEDAPNPEPAVGDVVVEVYACGFTPGELEWPIWRDRAGRERPWIVPGHEFSGVVSAVGFGTAGVAVGDEVFGLIDGYRDGAAAEYLAIEARDVAPKPTTLDHVHAAALPQAGLTSWQALFVHGELRRGKRAVIHGAGGGVGLTAVELGRWAGAHVIGTGHARSESSVLEAGADAFVDLEQDGWEARLGEVDVVFDLIGGEVLDRSVAIVTPGGAVVTATFPPSTTRDDVRIVHFVREPSGAQLRQLRELIDSGQVRPHVGAVYPLAQTQEAFRAKSDQRIPGKVVLQVRD